MCAFSPLVARMFGEADQLGQFPKLAEAAV